MIKSADAQFQYHDSTLICVCNLGKTLVNQCIIVYPKELLCIQIKPCQLDCVLRQHIARSAPHESFQ